VAGGVYPYVGVAVGVYPYVGVAGGVYPYGALYCHMKECFGSSC